MPHEAVEVVRRRGADVALDVGDSRDRSTLRSRGRWPRARFARAAVPFGHVDDDLEFALVVERQHLHLHELERHERDRRQQQQRDAAQEDERARVRWR